MSWEIIKVSKVRSTVDGKGTSFGTVWLIQAGRYRVMLKVFLFNRARKVCRINSSGEIICQNGAKYLKCEVVKKAVLFVF